MAKKFLGNSRGNVTILFAIALVPMLLAAGAGLDYLRAMRAQTIMQAAVDGAAMAVATSDLTSDSAKVAVGKDFLARNLIDGDLAAAARSVTINGSLVTVSTSFDYPTSLMRLGGIWNVPIAAVADVDIGKKQDAELVMVLDVSGSMKKSNKYIRMRDAATKMITNIEAATDSKLKVGLVPFSAMVLASMDASYVSQAAAGATWTGCTQDRMYPWNIGVDTPDGSADAKWGYVDPGFENDKPYDCSAYVSKNLEVMPLTSDMAAVKAKLAAIVPIGNTNIPLGVEFGWNLLDPQAPYTEGAPYSDTKTKKFMLILTDGVQTSRQWGDKGNRSVDIGNDNLVKLCNGINGKGITVFAIAYDVTAAKVTDLLKQCAPGGNYFEASTSGSEIDQVFSVVTQKIKKTVMRLAR